MYTWNNEWLGNYESMYGILNKFAYANIIKMSRLKSLLKINYKVNNYKEYSEYALISNAGLNEESLSHFFGIDILDKIKSEVKEILGAFGDDGCFEDNIKILWDRKFKYCKYCLELGYHSLYHQLKFIDDCLFHGSPLQDNCNHCNAVTTIDIGLTPRRPYTCINCGYVFQNGNVEDLIEIWHKIKPSITIPKTKYKAKYISLKYLLDKRNFDVTLSNKAKRLIYEIAINNTLPSGSDFIFGKVLKIHLKKIEDQIVKMSEYDKFRNTSFYLNIFNRVSRNIRRKLLIKESELRNILSQLRCNSHTLDINKYKRQIAFIIWYSESLGLRCLSIPYDLKNYFSQRFTIAHTMLINYYLRPEFNPYKRTADILNNLEIHQRYLSVALIKRYYAIEKAILTLSDDEIEMLTDFGHISKLVDSEPPDLIIVEDEKDIHLYIID